MVFLLSLPTKSREKNEVEQASKGADAAADLPSGNLIDQMEKIATCYLLCL